MFKLGISVLLFIFSFSCYSDDQKLKVNNKVKYVCGTRCIDINMIMFELRGDNNFVRDRSLFSSKMESFDDKLQKEIKHLKIHHNITVRSSFSTDGRFLPSFESMESALKVYVTMTSGRPDYSLVNLEVVSLSEEGINLQKFVCKKGDGKCIDESLSEVFETHVLGYLREPSQGQVIAH